jgi:hypothetical protein
VIVSGLFVLGGCAEHSPFATFVDSTKDCAEMLLQRDIQEVAKTREERFLGKVPDTTARCLGGKKAENLREGPWQDWPNYWAAGDAASRAPARLLANAKVVGPNAHGINGALYELELQRVELIKFNLFDNNNTYEAYVTGRTGEAGPVLNTWPEMRLPRSHPDFASVGGDQEQVCRGALIRFRTLTGICNDIRNPLMGSTHQFFARNVDFDTTFPDLGLNELTKNRHGDRIGLLKPDPQVISRTLFTRPQLHPDTCREGYGLSGSPTAAECEYKKAPFFNVLAAFWIQFMTHDWFTHLEEGRNRPEWMAVGCMTQLVKNIAQPLASGDVKTLGCRPDDKIDAAIIERMEPKSFTQAGKTYLTRAPKITANHVTAWWDASQLYGYDERSVRRVKHDPNDPAKLLLMPVGEEAREHDKLGYLPIFEAGDPINPEWSGQEATAFPDNWSIGMSFYHNVFAREHNTFVDAFRNQAELTPNGDSGLKNPAEPDRVISYQDVTATELFGVARLVVAAEIAKVHTIEWTTQLLYNEPLHRGMNANWSGVFAKQGMVADALKEVVRRLGDSENARKANSLYAVFAGGPGIFGLGNRVYEGVPLVGLIDRNKTDRWDLKNDNHINGGVNHFGSPFNFPEEFITAYRLHPLLPDLIEYREWDKEPNVIRQKVPVIETFRGKATEAMQQKGLANWALSMGRQRLGLLTLQNHPQFLQNLKMNRLQSPTQQIDVAALDLIRDRERGVPRYNEFRRQYGLKQLTSFDDFVDTRLFWLSSARREQEQLVKLLREVYGQHQCDVSKKITEAQLDDCLGHLNGSLIDNIEDVDTVVGWLSEFRRPHGFAISETQFVVFILNASRRLFSDRFFTSSFRPEFYSSLGVEWVTNNGPGPEMMEEGTPSGHEQQVSPMKRILLRTMPELASELQGVVNVFDPWARDRGEYYGLDWKPRAGAEEDEAFANK